MCNSYAGKLFRDSPNISCEKTRICGEFSQCVRKRAHSGDGQALAYFTLASMAGTHNPEPTAVISFPKALTWKNFFVISETPA